MFTLRGMNRDELMKMLACESGEQYGSSILHPDSGHVEKNNKASAAKKAGKKGRKHQAEQKVEIENNHAVENNHKEESIPEALSIDPARFWGTAADNCQISFPEADISLVATLPRNLGSFPFWRGEAPFINTLDTIYRQTSQQVMRLSDTR